MTFVTMHTYGTRHDNSCITVQHLSTETVS